MRLTVTITKRTAATMGRAGVISWKRKGDLREGVREEEGDRLEDEEKGHGGGEEEEGEDEDGALPGHHHLKGGCRGRSGGPTLPSQKKRFLPAWCRHFLVNFLSAGMFWGPPTPPITRSAVEAAAVDIDSAKKRIRGRIWWEDTPFWE